MNKPDTCNITSVQISTPCRIFIANCEFPPEISVGIFLIGLLESRRLQLNSFDYCCCSLSLAQSPHKGLLSAKVSFLGDNVPDSPWSGFSRTGW